ncbi:cell division control protein 7 [Encephalitozoon cuniculi]|nr:cell division cycle 7-related protein kinase [Encephalitozoon cuniculi]UYI27126.1 cell division control protein 7 [Encephalitozoon cuniculi]
MEEEKILESDLRHISFVMPKYTPIEKIGEGSFSVVYKALDAESGRYVALKAITRTSSPARVLDEMMFLKTLGGRKNCMGLLGCFRNEDQVVAVFPYFEPIDFREFISNANLADIKRYLHNLLIAIEHVHSNGIMHRDLKPGNFLYNKESGRGMLIDFGLAQYEEYSEGQHAESGAKPAGPLLFFNSVVSKTKPPGYYERDGRPPMKAPRAGTRGFRAPEVLFRCQRQTGAIDMWSVGVIFLTILTTQYPFFYSSDDIDSIVEIATIFGHAEMRKAAKFYGRVWRSNIDSIPEERIPFETIVESLNPWAEVGSDGYDLLYRMLDLCSSSRITASDALSHPFFDDLKTHENCA